MAVFKSPVSGPHFIDFNPASGVLRPERIYCGKNASGEPVLQRDLSASADSRVRPNGRFKLREIPLDTAANAFDQAQRRWGLRDNKPAESVSSMEDLVPGWGPAEDGRKVENQSQKDSQNAGELPPRSEPYVRPSGRIDFGARPRRQMPSNSSPNNLNAIYRVLGFTDKTDEQTRLEVVLAYREFQNIAVSVLKMEEASGFGIYHWDRYRFRDAYREIARRFHPDRNPNATAEEREIFVKTNSAWNTIRSYREWV